MPNLKGLAFCHLRDFVIMKHGNAALDNLLKKLPPDAAHALNVPAAHAWYPLETYVEIEKAIVDLFYNGDETQAYLIGEHDLLLSLRSVYKFILKILDAGTIIRRADWIWHKYADQGTLKVKHLHSTAAEVHLCGINPIHPVYCHDVRGSLTGCLEATSAKAVKVTHTECVLKGAPYCSYRAIWNMPDHLIKPSHINSKANILGMNDPN